MRTSLVSAFLLTVTCGAAQAFEPLEGFFIALDRCEAYQSKNMRTNPGHRFTEPMRAYFIRGMNTAGGDFYQIIDTAAPVTEDRWVHVSCGVHVVDAGTYISSNDETGTGESDEGLIIEAGEESMNNVLALSWQPAFCESRPNKIECINLNEGLLPITEQQLSIHGLWAQPRGNVYCGVPDAMRLNDENGQWQLLPDPALSAETREALDVAMPGTASHLERHEWIKHGTCHHGQGGAEEYFNDTLMLTQAINDSAVASYMAEHVGARVDTADIREQFDEAFGTGAGKRVQFHCTGDQGRVLLQEMIINLRGVIGPQSSLTSLLLAADEISQGCPAGMIDPGGLQ